VITNLNLAFDMGCLFDAALGCRIVCCGHMHADHCGSLAHHSRVRAMRGDPRSTYVIPACSIEQFKVMFGALYSLDHGMEHGFATDQIEKQIKKQIELVGAKHELVYELGKNRVLQCIATIHRVPSFAYVVSERRLKLLAKFVGMCNDNELDTHYSDLIRH
jgi:ribonuclease BN (tRNA processing enzyme)